MQVETSFDYPYPCDLCYLALKNNVLSNLRIKVKIGYSFGKIRINTANVKIIQEDFRAHMLQAKMELRAYGLIPYTIGPILKIYCIVTGLNRCSVEFVAESTSYTDSQLLNFYMEIITKIPGYSHLLKSGIMPKTYFDDVVVYDENTYKEGSISENANIRSFKYIFKKTNLLLKSYLEER